MNLQTFYKLIGQKIKSLREEKGYTQEQLSEKADISCDYLGKIERNINNPGFIALFKIINALEVSFEEFFYKM